jgi:hypothetical protein
MGFAPAPIGFAPGGRPQAATEKTNNAAAARRR